MSHYSAEIISQLMEWSIRHRSAAFMGLAIASTLSFPLQSSSAASDGSRSPVFASATASVSSPLVEVSTVGTIPTATTLSATGQIPQSSPYLENRLQLAQAITPANDGAGTVVEQTGNTFNVTGGTQAGANLFHSFEQFGLDANQAANIVSNPDIANVLGRVVGGDPSVINGLLQVTGGNSNLFLMNPAGIIFGPDASVFVPGAFTATTTNAIQLDDYWFNALGSNDYANLVGTPSGFAFTTNEPGAVINAGSLNGQSVTLLGGFVVNTGTIKTPGGNITVASVPEESLVRITQDGSLLSLELPVEVQDSLNNSPALTALDIPTLLSGSSIPQDLGLIVEDGAVKLVSTNTTIPTDAGTTIVSGTLDASAQTASGGRIDVLGERVALLNATLQASGGNGGGSVRVGGDYQGQGTVPNAEQTHIDADSTISADALAAGNGGRVIVWADNSTRFYGTTSAQGGASSGNGGFTEVSGRQNLVFDGTADLSADNGAFGVLLLDPKTIRIATGPSSEGVEGELPDIFADSFPGDEVTINAATLTSQTGNIILEATDDIIIQNGLSLNFASCTISSCPSISFQADANNDGVGSFLMDRTQSIAAPGRSIVITAANIEVGEINSNNSEDSSNSENSPIKTTIELTATAGNITTGNIRGGGTVRLTANQNIFTGFIFNYIVPPSSDFSRPQLDLSNPYGGVFLSTKTGDIRVSGIDTLPGYIDISSGGLFQAIGVLPTFPQTLGNRFPSSQLPRVDINAPENWEIKNFLILEGYLTIVDGDEQNFLVNTEAIRTFLEDSSSAGANSIPENELEALLLIREGDKAFIRSSVKETPISILARGFQEEVFIRITINGKPTHVTEGDLPGLLVPSNEFIIGPQVGNLPSSEFELFSNTSLTSSNDISIIYRDYSLPLIFGSVKFPTTISGVAGTIVSGFLESNIFIGSTLLPVEYEPPQLPSIPQNPTQPSIPQNPTQPSIPSGIPPIVERNNNSPISVVNDPLLSATFNSTENLTLRSQDGLNADDRLEDEEKPKDSICEMFASSEVLSVSEVTPEECQLSNTSENQQ